MMSMKCYVLVSLGLPRDHHSFYVEINSTNCSGDIYQVSGNVQTGMYFNHKQDQIPDKMDDFISKEYIGLVAQEDYSNGKFEKTVNSIDPPSKQFEGPRRLYPEVKLRRCQEWTAEVKAALIEEMILH